MVYTHTHTFLTPTPTCPRPILHFYATLGKGQVTGGDGGAGDWTGEAAPPFPVSFFPLLPPMGADGTCHFLLPGLRSAGDRGQAPPSLPTLCQDSTYPATCCVCVLGGFMPVYHACTHMGSSPPPLPSRLFCAVQTVQALSLACVQCVLMSCLLLVPPHPLPAMHGPACLPCTATPTCNSCPRLHGQVVFS